MKWIIVLLSWFSPEVNVYRQEIPAGNTEAHCEAMIDRVTKDWADAPRGIRLRHKLSTEPRIQTQRTTQMSTDKWYLAAPMTGVPQFNFPALIAATAALRGNGYTITTPAELDSPDVQAAAMASATGDQADVNMIETWGDMLARDVKIITDEMDGIVFLPGWDKSKGARLEAFVGILTGKIFGRYVPEHGGIEAMSPQTVLTLLTRTTHEEIRNVGL